MHLNFFAVRPQVNCGPSLEEPSLTCDPEKDINSCVKESAQLCEQTAGCLSFGLSEAYVVLGSPLEAGVHIFVNLLSVPFLFF
jgi:hypothetical protein